MNNRTKATSIPKKVREEVYTRDKGCIIEMDNGKNSLEIKARVKKYLDNLYPDFADEMRKYDKWRREE